MGGIGSGRRNQGGKSTTSDHWVLDARRLQRDGLLIPGRFFDLSWSRNGETIASIQVRTETDELTLIYRHKSCDGDWQAVECPVRLDWTPCNYGGRRAWFICPAKGCGRRVAILYSGGIFACRHCYQLVYACQLESDDDRAARRADRIRTRLGWQPGILNYAGGKPKGMRWRTFKRLTGQHDTFVGVSLAGMMIRLGGVDRRLTGLLCDLIDGG